MINYICADCKILKTKSRKPKSGRCRPCATRYQLRNPKNHPNYKHGKTLVKNYCKKCSKELSDYTSKYCQNCWAKKRFSKPENNSNYIDGRTLKKAKCIDCGKKLKTWSSKRCYVCRGKYHSKLISGPKSVNWIDGRSYEKYPKEFSESLKNKIKERDNYECQNCGMTQAEHYALYGRDIEVHHIDYNRKNCSETNLITTCKQCNLRANINRDYWQNYYSNKVREKLLK